MPTGIYNSPNRRGGVKGKSGVYIRTKPIWNKGKKTGLAPWLGKKRPDISAKMMGHPLYEGSKKGFYKKGVKPWNVGRKVPQISGENHPNWKGGVTPLMLQIRHCFEYRQWRSDIFTKDDFTCQKCKVRGGKLEADHYPKKFSTIFHENKIKSLEEALSCEEFWNINNGRTLCKKCHRESPVIQ